MKQYIVDAFANELFSGNPAAVCVMDEWITEELMMKITKENNLSETAFAVREGKKYHLRWFTPGGEIDLCGHATLATAFVIMNFYDKECKKIVFKTLSGDLIVERKGELYEMSFPAYSLDKIDNFDIISKTLGIIPKEVYLGRDLLCVLNSPSEVYEFEPQLDKIKELDGLILHITAESNDENIDCVSRSFAPKLNVSEDHVCGSGHCHIVPYWSNKLGKKDIVAYQSSERGGYLYCKDEGEKVILAGKGQLYSIAEINV